MDNVKYSILTYISFHTEFIFFLQIKFKIFININGNKAYIATTSSKKGKKITKTVIKSF